MHLKVLGRFNKLNVVSRFSSITSPCNRSMLNRKWSTWRQGNSKDFCFYLIYSFGQQLHCSSSYAFKAPVYQIDNEYFDDPKSQKSIRENLHNRNSCTQDQIIGNHELQASLPNNIHPDVAIGNESNARLIEEVGSWAKFEFKPREVVDIGNGNKKLRIKNVFESTGPKTYYFKQKFAKLEKALIQYTVTALLKKGFTLLTVPDLIHPSIIEGCGFQVTGERNQVYRLLDKHGHVCLAGTGEMPIAGYLSNSFFKESEMPQKFMTVSRCYRAEVSNVDKEKGIYRVHQFNKVEMFGVTRNEFNGNSSQELMDSFMEIQRQLFTNLGLHFRILDMPSQELGPSAYRKYDIEVLMPAKNVWGEVSSTSNCTDYQSRRLNIKYKTENGDINFCHTVNGTACAVPRMMMAIIESFQRKNGDVEIPKVLRKFMRNADIIEFESSKKRKWIQLTREYKKMTKQGK